jgi:hypothetical protein
MHGTGERIGSQVANQKRAHDGFVIDQINAELQGRLARLDGDQCERFYAWLRTHIEEQATGFGPGIIARQEWLRRWFEERPGSLPLLFLEYALIESQIEHCLE